MPVQQPERFRGRRPPVRRACNAAYPRTARSWSPDNASTSDAPTPASSSPFWSRTTTSEFSTEPPSSHCTLVPRPNRSATSTPTDLEVRKACPDDARSRMSRAHTRDRRLERSLTRNHHPAGHTSECRLLSRRGALVHSDSDGSRCRTNRTNVLGCLVRLVRGWYPA